jgi:hypothetical protein
MFRWIRLFLSAPSVFNKHFRPGTVGMMPEGRRPISPCRVQSDVTYRNTMNDLIMIV